MQCKKKKKKIVGARLSLDDIKKRGGAHGLGNVSVFFTNRGAVTETKT